MVIGEAPGETEAERGEPFVGRAGKEQDRYLAIAGWPMGIRPWYRTNVVKEYTPGNPDPTPAQIAQWSGELEREIREVRPMFIIAVGRFAARWFLGNVDMDTVHGIVHRSDKALGAAVIPVYHPAAGFYDNDIRAVIMSDYRAAVNLIQGSDAVTWFGEDEYEGREAYLDAGGAYIDRVLLRRPFYPINIALDTEGTPDNPWSIQISIKEGTGVVLRRERDDFARGIAALQREVDRGSLIVVHNGMYDIEMCRVMGLELRDARLFDTMYAAYLMRVEPQGLKPLAYRWCRMKMADYVDTVGHAGLEKQLAYLWRVAESDWPKPEPRALVGNDGEARVYKPQPVARRAEAILLDWYADKRDKDGDRVDPLARWHKVDREQRDMVERLLGPMPIGTLADIHIDDAIRYAARDPDATLRLYHRMRSALEHMGLAELQDNGMEVLPIFEEMQYNGMPASRRHFVDLADDMWDRMCRLQARISNRWFDGRPFNPASSEQVATIMRRRGIQGMKRTKTGRISTSKKSVEHYRYTDDAMAAIIEWREHQKVKDSFCEPIIAAIPEGCDIAPIRGSLKITRVATRRISMANPNLLAIPVRNELGKQVRDGYRVPDGEAFGSWDLSQIEMRYMAHLSRDPLLIRFFHERRDVHRETAARIFGIRLDQVEELAHRYPAKRAGFGIITNITGHGLLDQLRMFGCQGWDENKCDDLIEEWLKVYKGVGRFLDDCRREVREHGMVRDHWGMIRYLPGVWSDDPAVIGDSERAASSHKIQGGAQGMIQRSMAWLRPVIRAMQQAGDNVKWRLQIHDEIILSFDERLWDDINALVIEALTQHSGIDLVVPVEASGHMSRTWGGLK